MDDNRFKVINFPRQPYPYTIEYTIVRKHSGLMFYPVFEPQGAPAEAVEQAWFEVKMPAGLELRFKEINVAQACKTGQWRWNFQHLPAFEPEPYAPVAAWEHPRILTAPTLFSLQGYEGDMRSWESFGKFIQTLNAGKDALPPTTQAKLKAMTANCPDVECKIRRVYEYLQENTRYYFVGLGIGGWQPMPAASVDQYKYSDCKGLSNYTVAMLRAVGVPAYYALIRAAAEEQDAQLPDFPNAWFNHVIVCVPLPQGDTIWLECTSQIESCGFLGSFTDSRPALLVTLEGGKLVWTPEYDETVNTIRRETEATVAADGSATLRSEETYRGMAQEIPSALADLPDEQRKKYLYKQLNVSDFEILRLEFNRNRGRGPEVKQHLEMTLPRLASVSGKRLFLPANLLASKLEIPPPPDSTRRFAVQARSRGLTEEDTLVFTVPEGYTLENTLEPVALTSVFGRYELTVQAETNRIRIHRLLVLNDSIQPKEQYAAFVQFIKNVGKADKTKLVLVR